MSEERSIESIKQAIIKDFEKQLTGEKLYSRVFSIYLLDRYAQLLYKIYQKAHK